MVARQGMDLSWDQVDNKVLVQAPVVLVIWLIHGFAPLELEQGPVSRS